MSTRIPIMAHTVLGYPTLDKSFDLIEQYIHSGVDILELQLPFSDPSADGPVITEANQVALHNGATINECWTLIGKLRDKYPKQEIMIMSYANKIHHIGVKTLLEQLQSLNIRHLIIPDLPIDTSLAKKIHETDFFEMVPVVSANMTDERLAIALRHNPSHVYVMASFSVTGQKFSLHEDVRTLIKKVQDRCDARIGVGFGIAEKKHIEVLRGVADFAIVGSSLLTAYKEQRLKEKLEELVM